MRKSKYAFVAIEGIDGVGKTTCARILGQKISAYYYKTPSGPFEKTRAEIDALNNHQLRFFFYLAAVIYASAEIDKLLSERPVVCDRYIYSTIAYHKALNVDLSYLTEIKRFPLLFPDFSIYLWAEEETYINRILARGSQSVSDEFLEKDRELQKRIHQEFLNLPVIPIDTSNLTPDEVCDRIITLL